MEETKQARVRKHRKCLMCSYIFFPGVIRLNKGVYWDMKWREWPGIRSERNLVVAKGYSVNSTSNGEHWGLILFELEKRLRWFNQGEI